MACSPRDTEDVLECRTQASCASMRPCSQPAYQVKNRMVAPKLPPPLYDQIQLVVYMLMLRTTGSPLQPPPACYIALSRTNASQRPWIGATHCPTAVYTRPS